MNVLDLIPFAADIAQIVTGIVSAAIAFWLWARRRKEQRTLERYLKKMTADRQRNGGQGLENLLEVMRRTKLSEEAVMRAAFRSKKVRVRSRLDGSQTKELVFGYGRHEER